MPIFKKKQNRSASSPLGVWIVGGSELPAGYHRLLDSPEISACINRIAAIISSATIYLMENAENGDVRVHDELARFVDVDPWPNMATRQSWMNWIVTQLLGEGDGEAFVLPRMAGGRFAALEPMPSAVSIEKPGGGYLVQWKGRTYAPDEVLHFRLYSNPEKPWKGRGVRVQANQLAASLQNTVQLKNMLSSPDYKPPLIVAVNSDNAFSDESERDSFREKYLSDSKDGKPWILPADLVKIEQLKPLSLTDLAIKDTVELDKKTATAIFGVPGFTLGVGSFSEAEHNHSVRTVYVPICQGIEQELTLKLLASPKRYFKISRRRLYAYDLKNLIDMDLAMADRGYLNGDEVRADMDLDPVGLTERTRLENFIPVDKAGEQKKLIQEDET
nr:MAG TPA: portal protein [Caudoviricetes sp.]